MSETIDTKRRSIEKTRRTHLGDRVHEGYHDVERKGLTGQVVLQRAWMRLGRDMPADRCIGECEGTRDVLTLRMCSKLQRTDRHIADADILGSIDLQRTQDERHGQAPKHEGGKKNKGTLNSESTTPPLWRGSMEAVEDVSVRVKL